MLSHFRAMYRKSPVHLSSLQKPVGWQDRQRHLAIEQYYVQKLQRIQNAVIRQENKHLDNALRRLGMKPDMRAMDEERRGKDPSPHGREVNGRFGDHRQTLWRQSKAHPQPAPSCTLPVIAATSITWGSSAECRRKFVQPVPAAATIVDEEIVRIVKEQRVRLAAASRQKAPPKLPTLRSHQGPPWTGPGSSVYEQVYEKTVRGRYKCVRRPHRLKTSMVRSNPDPKYDPFMREIGIRTKGVDTLRMEKVAGCAAPATSPVDWAATQHGSYSALLLKPDALPPTSPVDQYHNGISWSETATRASSVPDYEQLTSPSESSLEDHSGGDNRREVDQRLAGGDISAASRKPEPEEIRDVYVEHAQRARDPRHREHLTVAPSPLPVVENEATVAV